MAQNSYAETAVTLFGLALLAIGTLAMIVRFLLHRRVSLNHTGQQLIADVKKGEGFTFHHLLAGPQSGTQVSRRSEPTLARDKKTSSLRPLRLQEWLNLVNHHPDAVPHLFIEGGSGTGKTTLATVVLHNRTGPIAIVGVKPDDGWSEGNAGYTYRSTEREPVLNQLLREVRRRLDDGDKSGITIVLDDFTRLASDHPSAVDLYKLVADVGRSLRIRLILIARGRQVKGIGARGESDLLEHFVFISVQRGHYATLAYNDETYPLDTEQVSVQARPLPQSRFWHASETSLESSAAACASHLLSSLLEQGEYEAVSVSGQPTTRETPLKEDTGTPSLSGIGHSNAGTQESEDSEDTEGIAAKLTPEAIQVLYSAWGSKSKIALMLSGKKQKRLAMIDAALEDATAEPAH